MKPKNVVLLGGAERVYSGQFEASADQAVARSRAWTTNNGADSNYDFFINDLLITRPAPADPVTYADSVTVVRPLDPWQMNSNADGIPDGWYLQHGFNPTGPSVAELDNDGDGFNNRQEYLLGTDPTDANSAFRIISILYDAGGFPRVTWRSVGGRTYRVEYSDNLAQGYSEAEVLTENAVADGVQTTRTFVDDYSKTGSPPATALRIYRIRAIGPPNP